MGERKVINKYYPPDFDPEKLTKRKRPKNDQIKIRMMMPMSVQCTTCGEYIYKGKKFNSRKETVENEDYLGIKIFRLYMRCPRCSAEFTIKTDPKNSDYTAEVGVIRNFEPWKARAEEEERAKSQRANEEEGNAMKALENRTMDSKREMDILDALDEIKALNAANSATDVDSLLDERRREAAEKRRLQEEEDDRLAAEMFRKATYTVKRLEGGDDEEDGEEEDDDNWSVDSEAPKKASKFGAGNGSSGSSKPAPKPAAKPAAKPSASAVLTAGKEDPVAKAKEEEAAAPAVPLVIVKAKKKKAKEPAGLALLAAYGSASDDDA
eukprot:tig00021238_g19549.t1